VTRHEPPASIRDHEVSPFKDGTNENRVAWVKLANCILEQLAPSVQGYQQALAYRPVFVRLRPRLWVNAPANARRALSPHLQCRANPRD
jgi:hypothetical protein